MSYRSRCARRKELSQRRIEARSAQIRKILKKMYPQAILLDYIYFTPKSPFYPNV